MRLELEAELLMEIKGYKCEGKESWDEGVDFIASDKKSDHKVLLRVITDPKSNSGMVGVDSVRDMVHVLKQDDYDKGVLISKSFSTAAKREMNQVGIRMISENYMPLFRPQQLYLTIQDCVDGLCKEKCGQVPEKEMDCEGKGPDGNYSCKTRLISDNASFHYQCGWMKLLRKDLKQLLTLQNSMDDQ
jgi:hypothetical protein